MPIILGRQIQRSSIRSVTPGVFRSGRRVLSCGRDAPKLQGRKASWLHRQPPMASSSANKTSLARSFRIVACPKCRAKLRFYRSPSPEIDERGFESYNIECTRCFALILGIVDPADNTLLLSEENLRRELPVAEKGERKPET